MKKLLIWGCLIVVLGLGLPQLIDAWRQLHFPTDDNYTYPSIQGV